jgi:hypothetical protein
MFPSAPATTIPSAKVEEEEKKEPKSSKLDKELLAKI